MFDIKQYYKQAHSGERVENSDLLNHIKKWDKYTKLLGFKSRYYSDRKWNPMYPTFYHRTER